ncbi:MAG: hypothetical protein ACE5HT_13295 [Gemmatimonadales bacterium]
MWLRIAAAVGVALLAASVTLAQSSRSRLERESLGVIPGFYVEVNGVPPYAVAGGLSPDSLRADIESILGRSNIRVLTQPEWQQTIGNPAIHLVLQLLRLSERQYLYTASLEVRQLIVLVRDSTKIVFTRTWSSRNLLGAISTAKLPSLRIKVRPLAEQLTRAYWSAVREETDRRRPEGRESRGRTAPENPLLQKKNPLPKSTIQRPESKPSPKR